jgi:hypothetical protein
MYDCRGWNWPNQELNWITWTFDGQLRVEVHKSETKNQDENDAKFQGWWLSSTWWNYIKLKVWRQLRVQLKIIGIKFVKS